MACPGYTEVLLPQQSNMIGAVLQAGCVLLCEVVCGAWVRLWLCGRLMLRWLSWLGVFIPAGGTALCGDGQTAEGNLGHVAKPQVRLLLFYPSVSCMCLSSLVCLMYLLYLVCLILLLVFPYSVLRPCRACPTCPSQTNVMRLDSWAVLAAARMSTVECMARWTSSTQPWARHWAEQLAATQQVRLPDPRSPSGIGGL